MTLTESHRDIIEHSLGIKNQRVKRPPYRNYYCAEKGAPELEELVTLGLMIRGRTLNDGTDQYYLVTEAGAAAVGAKLPKED